MKHNEIEKTYDDYYNEAKRVGASDRDAHEYAKEQCDHSRPLWSIEE
ncbi:MAG: hypothetical protein ACTSWQ_08675 [Candidatus Thorarchaeota archaeon]